MSSHEPTPGAPRGPAQRSNSSKKPAIIIGIIILGILAIPCLGILAAIAIPAFLRYIKASKSAEAQAVLMRMANEVESNYADQCAFPVELERHAEIADCSEGAKCLPARELEPFWASIPQLTEPTYFVYSARKEGDQMVLRAEADFIRGEPYHTESTTISVVGECQVEASPTIVMNEFE